ncbi:MAG: prepilin-type N-terminal cleavage/methylation domain-containing protein [candidate division Zixibacteria bacterium]|nr:prepilin-type N-terminal cleavage/methylation domain-containing protein [candidate division Zixibacteria bacterium]
MNHRKTILPSPPARGFTLIEILMTVVVLGILATVALRSLQNSIDASRVRETQAEIDELARAIAGNPDLYNNGLRSDFGYVGDVGALPSTLDNLMTNPGGYATWKGPYVTRRFTQDADGFKKDAWGNLYTFSSGITIASTGGGTTPMTKSVAPAAADLTTTPVTGTVTDAAGNPPGDSSVAVTIRLTYPNGSGSTTTATATPNSGGSFSLSGIPVGLRTVQAIYRATNDTVAVATAILPKSGATVAMRLPKSPFAGNGGGGGGSATLVYVPGTAATATSNRDMLFNIFNSGSAGVIITSATATYSPTLYYQTVQWGGTTVFSYSGSRPGSGTPVTFTAGQPIGPGTVVTVRFNSFYTAPSGGGYGNVSATAFTVTFSNGSTVSFTTP